MTNDPSLCDRAELPTEDDLGIQPTRANILCNLTVAAEVHCPTIIAAAHALYYWPLQIGHHSCEYEYRKLVEAFAKLEDAIRDLVVYHSFNTPGETYGQE